MGLLDRLRALLRRVQCGDEDMRYSVVMLMRSPFLLTKETLEEAVARAYGVPYDEPQTMYFVVRDGR